MEVIKMLQELSELYALVDVTSIDATVFLKRAPILEITLWGKIYSLSGKFTKRLDLITDLDTLQYLYWNTTETPPADDPDTVKAKCEELANKLEVDTTSAEELTSRIPPEMLKTNGQRQEEERINMAKKDRALNKPSAAKGRK